MVVPLAPASPGGSPRNVPLLARRDLLVPRLAPGDGPASALLTHPWVFWASRPWRGDWGGRAAASWKCWTRSPCDGACHRRRLGVSRGPTPRPATRLSGDGRPEGTVEDDGPGASRAWAPVRGTMGRRPADRAADAITAFAGSMGFVSLHVIGFVLWLKVEPLKDVFPQGLPTIVSLEAIFLSTFVTSSQNRADVKRAGSGRPPVGRCTRS
jgi:hypothetical protein